MCCSASSVSTELYRAVAVPFTFFEQPKVEQISPCVPAVAGGQVGAYTRTRTCTHAWAQTNKGRIAAGFRAVAGGLWVGDQQCVCSSAMRAGIDASIYPSTH